MGTFGSLFVAVYIISAYSQTIPDSERSALMSFYVSTFGSAWLNHNDWNTSSEPCTWFGVVCANGHVDGLFLSGNNMVGSIPESIGGLSMLSGLDLSSNELSGRLPEALNKLTNLYAVAVRENKLAGPFPFSNLYKMQFAHLDFNAFDGTLEPLKGCKGLKVLGLTDNAISGTIPPEFGLMKELQTLFLGGNDLVGTVPPLQLAALTAMDLSRNKLQGRLPRLQDFAGLVEYMAFSNAFSGGIAGALAPHDRVVVLDASSNALSGSVPAALATGLPQLDILHLQDNGLSGFLPSEFAQSRVYSIDFAGNPFLCPLPPSVAATHAACKWWCPLNIVPSSGSVAGGVDVVISGTDFVAGVAGVECGFGALRVPATVVTAATITCSAPAAPAAGAVPVSLFYAGKTIANRTLSFTYVQKQPRAAPAAPREYAAVSVVVLGESKCPDMASAESIFLSLLRAVGPDVLDLRLGWIARRNALYPTGYWSLHGQTEIIGNALTLCAQQRYGLEPALEYAGCMDANITSIPSNAAACAAALGLDSAALLACALGAEGAALVDAGVALGEKYGAVWSPTIWIDGELYCLWHSSPCKAQSESDFRRAVCAAYKGPKPPACEESL